MLWTALLFVSATATAKPYFAASDQDVRSAHCHRVSPVSEHEMSDWLQRKSAGGSRISKNIFGIELREELPYFADLLEALLKSDPASGVLQKTYQSQCRQVVCVTKELFGERAGLQLLYMLGKYGFNGSHLRTKNADPWRADELDTVLLALSDLPGWLTSRPRAAMNHPLVHVKRSDDLTGHQLANAVIQVFNIWNQQSPELQRYALFHELGHNAAFDFALDDSAAWYEASDWKEMADDWKDLNPERKISGYAETRPDEDFAESFAAYRYAPARLKKVNPKVYQFMKKNAFRNVEYLTEDGCVRER